MKINKSISALENLIALILADNVGKTLTAEQFTAGVPVEADDGQGRNTTVTLTAVAGQGYTGSVDFDYTRLGLNSGVAEPVSSVEVAGEDDEAATLAKIATALGLVESELESSEYEAPVDDQTPGSVTVSAKAGSLLYVGAPVVITLTLPSEVVPTMGETFTTTSLNGFEAETGE